MTDPRLTALRDLIQQDPGERGLRADPADNLVTRTAGDFEAACRSIAETPNPSLAVVTGFYIAHADPPCGETDGPLGALFLARSLLPLGVRVSLHTDPLCRPALEAGLEACGLGPRVAVLDLPPADAVLGDEWLRLDCGEHAERVALTHLIALERVGPSHADGRCYSMRGRDITDHTGPAHLLFEAAARRPGLVTIGIGDGGNEIGMGKLPREVLARNIPRADRIGCRVPTDHLIVAGVSNWGAYGLAAGVGLLRGAAHDPALFDPRREQELLALMVERGPLVDGVSGRRAATVDGLPFDRYARVLEQVGQTVASARG
jgi:hypothetical protein